jgi:hypothetical protein
MPRTERKPDQNYCCDIYRGHHIAVFNHHGRWHAYLDHMFSPMVFATAENAMRWLARRVDLTTQRAV